MITAVQTRHYTDANNVFVNGLSAGGAMAAVMLSTYPEVFAAGAVIAGLPFAVADTVPEAFDRMRGHGGPPPEALAELVKNASAHTGPWPRLSVWHGSADNTVDQLNASALLILAEKSACLMASPASFVGRGSFAISMRSVSTSAHFPSSPVTSRAACRLMRPILAVPKITGMNKVRLASIKLLLSEVQSLQSANQETGQTRPAQLGPPVTKQTF